MSATITVRAMRRRVFAAAIATLAIVGGLLATTGTASATQSAWTDSSYATAAVTAGKWTTVLAPSSCVAMTPQGKPLAGGTCTITGITANAWDNGTYKVRDYQVAVSTNAGSGYVVFDVDLSTFALAGPWSWAKAGTIATGHFTPVAGYKCSELPRLRATGPSNWGSNYQIMVRVIEDRTMAGPGPITCG